MPPRGSVQDTVLREMVQRERYEEFEKFAFIGRMIGVALHVPDKVAAHLEDLLSLAIFQTAYDPGEIQRQLQETRERIEKEREVRLREAKLLAKVASYSEDVEDEAQEAFKRHLQGTTRFHGVRDPWAASKK